MNSRFVKPIQPSELLFRASSTLEVGDDVCSVLGVGDASEGHSVARCEGGGTLEPLVEVTVRPLDGSLG